MSIDHKRRLRRPTILFCIAVLAMSVGCASTATTPPQQVSEDPMKAAAARCPGNMKLGCTRAMAGPLKCSCMDDSSLLKMLENY